MVFRVYGLLGPLLIKSLYLLVEYYRLRLRKNPQRHVLSRRIDWRIVWLDGA